MYSVENPAGRLVTFRVSAPVDDGNAISAATDLRTVIQSIDGPVVVCTDLTEGRTFAPPTAQRFIAVMQVDNPRIERSALLLPADGATVLLQVERMLREAGSTARKAFLDSRELVAWMLPLLSPIESAALDVFLGGR